MMSVTLLMRSPSATELPPNFSTFTCSYSPMTLMITRLGRRPSNSA